MESAKHAMLPLSNSGSQKHRRSANTNRTLWPPQEAVLSACTDAGVVRDCILLNLCKLQQFTTYKTDCNPRWWLSASWNTILVWSSSEPMEFALLLRTWWILVAARYILYIHDLPQFYKYSKRIWPASDACMLDIKSRATFHRPCFSQLLTKEFRAIVSNLHRTWQTLGGSREWKKPSNFRHTHHNIDSFVRFLDIDTSHRCVCALLDNPKVA